MVSQNEAMVSQNVYILENCQSISPTYLQNYLPVIQHSRNPTRQFSAIPSKTDYFGNSFFPHLLIRRTVKISMFKKSLLKFVRPSQAYVYNVNDYVG